MVRPPNTIRTDGGAGADGGGVTDNKCVIIISTIYHSRFHIITIDSGVAEEQPAGAGLEPCLWGQSVILFISDIIQRHRGQSSQGL